MESKIVLYQLEDCPYCHLVRRKLDFLDLNFTAVAVSHEGSERDEVRRISGQQAVPVLQDGDKTITGSQEIVAHLDAAYGPKELVSGDYGIRTEVSGDFESIYKQTIEAFKAVGFGLLTEIDVKATMKKKIDKDMAPYSILGFCNPNFAYQGLSAEPELGLLLPCNVVIREIGAGRYGVSAAHPVKMFAPVGRPEMLPLAEEVAELLKKAIESLS